MIPAWLVASAYLGWGFFLWLVLAIGDAKSIQTRVKPLPMPWPARIVWFLAALCLWPLLSLIGLWVLVVHDDE